MVVPRGGAVLDWSQQIMNVFYIFPAVARSIDTYTSVSIVVVGVCNKIIEGHALDPLINYHYSYAQYLLRHCQIIR